MATHSLINQTAAAMSTRMARFANWARARQTARALKSTSPAVREDLGLSLADMARIGY